MFRQMLIWQMSKLLKNDKLEEKLLCILIGDLHQILKYILFTYN